MSNKEQMVEKLSSVEQLIAFATEEIGQDKYDVQLYLKEACDHIASVKAELVKEIKLKSNE